LGPRRTEAVSAEAPTVRKDFGSTAATAIASSPGVIG
jgi:hypothetical protein